MGGEFPTSELNHSDYDNDEDFDWQRLWGRSTPNSMDPSTTQDIFEGMFQESALEDEDETSWVDQFMFDGSQNFEESIPPVGNTPNAAIPVAKFPLGSSPNPVYLTDLTQTSTTDLLSVACLEFRPDCALNSLSLKEIPILEDIDIYFSCALRAPPLLLFPNIDGWTESPISETEGSAQSTGRNSGEELPVLEQSPGRNLGEELFMLEQSTGRNLGEELLMLEQSTGRNLGEELLIMEQSIGRKLREELLLLEQSTGRNLGEELLLLEQSTGRNSGEELPVLDQSTRRSSGEELPVLEQSTGKNSGEELPVLEQSTRTNSGDELPVLKQSTGRNSGEELPALKQSTGRNSGEELPALERSTGRNLGKELPVLNQQRQRKLHANWESYTIVPEVHPEVRHPAHPDRYKPIRHKGLDKGEKLRAAKKRKTHCTCRMVNPKVEVPNLYTHNEVWKILREINMEFCAAMGNIFKAMMGISTVSHFRHLDEDLIRTICVHQRWKDERTPFHIHRRCKSMAPATASECCFSEQFGKDFPDDDRIMDSVEKMCTKVVNDARNGSPKPLVQFPPFVKKKCDDAFTVLWNAQSQPKKMDYPKEAIQKLAESTGLHADQVKRRLEAVAVRKRSDIEAQKKADKLGTSSQGFKRKTDSRRDTQKRRLKTVAVQKRSSEAQKTENRRLEAVAVEKRSEDAQKADKLGTSSQGFKRKTDSPGDTQKRRLEAVAVQMRSEDAQKTENRRLEAVAVEKRSEDTQKTEKLGTSYQGFKTKTDSPGDAQKWRRLSDLGIITRAASGSGSGQEIMRGEPFTVPLPFATDSDLCIAQAASGSGSGQEFTCGETFTVPLRFAAVNSSTVSKEPANSFGIRSVSADPTQTSKLPEELGSEKDQ